MASIAAVIGSMSAAAAGQTKASIVVVNGRLSAAAAGQTKI